MSLLSIALFVMVFVLALLLVVMIILRLEPTSKQTHEEHDSHRPPK